MLDSDVPIWILGRPEALKEGTPSFVGVPDALATEALLVALRVCPECKLCGMPCRCGGYVRETNAIILRYIWNEQRKQFQDLCRKISGPRLDVERRPAIGPILEIIDAATLKQRQPEREGFEMDHPGSRFAYQPDRPYQWQRFCRYKPLKLKRK